LSSLPIPRGVRQVRRHGDIPTRQLIVTPGAVITGEISFYIADQPRAKSGTIAFENTDATE
jgi:cytoskeletal protein CcmA (bactofilin family)